MVAILVKRRIARVSNRKAAEQYHDSFAEQLSDLFGRSRWALAELASTIWEHDLRGRIDELVQTNHSTIYKGQAVRVASICHCWMLGYSKECALPTVVVCCNEPTILRRSMHVIIKHQLLKPKSFDIKGIPSWDVCLYGYSVPDPLSQDSQGVPIRPLQALPGQTAAPFEASRQQAARNLAALEAQLCAGKTGRNICGTRLIVERSLRRATLGGALIVNDKYYGLTCAHVFEDNTSAIELPRSVVTDDQMYDSDWAEQSSNESDEDETPGSDPVTQQSINIRATVNDHEAGAPEVPDQSQNGMGPCTLTSVWTVGFELMILRPPHAYRTWAKSDLGNSSEWGLSIGRWGRLRYA